MEELNQDDRKTLGSYKSFYGHLKRIDETIENWKNRLKYFKRRSVIISPR